MGIHRLGGRCAWAGAGSLYGACATQRGEREYPVRGASWYLLVAEVLAIQGVLKSLTDLLARDGVQVGGLEDVIDDGRVARLLIGGDCPAWPSLANKEGIVPRTRRRTGTRGEGESRKTHVE